MTLKSLPVAAMDGLGQRKEVRVLHSPLIRFLWQLLAQHSHSLVSCGEQKSSTGLCTHLNAGLQGEHSSGSPHS